MKTKEVEVRILLSKLCDSTRVMVASEKDETIDKFAREIVNLFSVEDILKNNQLQTAIDGLSRDKQKLENKITNYTRYGKSPSEIEFEYMGADLESLSKINFEIKCHTNCLKVLGRMIKNNMYI